MIHVVIAVTIYLVRNHNNILISLQVNMRILTYMTLLVLIVIPASAKLLTGTDEQAQLPFWQWQTEVLSLRFVQRLPDQSRAYFAGRGFQKDDAELIAGHCIFQTVFKNIAPAGSQQVIEYDLNNWRIAYQEQKLLLKKREDWQAIWQQRQVKPAQTIAFEWSLLPTKQRYQPADYNWGMSVFPVPHGAMFDLQLSWSVNGKPRQAVIKNMQCANDITIAPASELVR